MGLFFAYLLLRVLPGTAEHVFVDSFVVGLVVAVIVVEKHVVELRQVGWVAEEVGLRGLFSWLA